MISVDAADRVVTAHGGGGALTQALIRDRILPILGNAALRPLTDAAVLGKIDGPLAFTTDSYVVTPVVFPGGDIGRLAVCGTVNDLAVMGAEPLVLSLGLILEEGLELELLDRVIGSIGAAAREAGVEVVTGDTKVIDRRAPGGWRPELMINTAGIGKLRSDTHLSAAHIAPGDQVLVNGRIAEHGLAIMSLRHGLSFDTPLTSDVAPLNGLIRELLDSGAAIRFLRDATRGGVAGVLADIGEQCGVSIEISESELPLSRAASQAAEMLGLDPLSIANEGKLVCIVAPSDASEVLRIMRSHPLGHAAACIGHVTDECPSLVALRTRIGGHRIIQRPYGEDLPRIC